VRWSFSVGGAGAAERLRCVEVEKGDAKMGGNFGEGKGGNAFNGLTNRIVLGF